MKFWALVAFICYLVSDITAVLPREPLHERNIAQCPVYHTCVAISNCGKFCSKFNGKWIADTDKAENATNCKREYKFPGICCPDRFVISKLPESVFVNNAQQKETSASGRSFSSIPSSSIYEKYQQSYQYGVKLLKFRDAFEQDLETMGLYTSSHSSSGLHTENSATQPYALKEERNNFIANTASKYLAHTEDINRENRGKDENNLGRHTTSDDSWNSIGIMLDAKTILGLASQTVTTCKLTQYRSIDGSCNNLRNPDWGKSFEPYKRWLNPMYDDGYNSPRSKGWDGRALPSARTVSSALATDVSRPSHTNTLLVMSWGQFLAHDVSSTPVYKSSTYKGLSCCSLSDPRYLHPDCFPIRISHNDYLSYKHGTSCMNFVRSLAVFTYDNNYGGYSSTREDYDHNYGNSYNNAPSYGGSYTPYGYSGYGSGYPPSYGSSGYTPYGYNNYGSGYTPYGYTPSYGYEGSGYSPYSVYGNSYDGSYGSYYGSQQKNSKLGVRQQINQMSSYLDASNVYGFTEDIAHSLREFKNGHLISQNVRGKQHLFTSIQASCSQAETCNRVLAGDHRANQEPWTTVLHTLLMREHNNLCNLIRAKNPTWGDELLFFEARRLLNAIYQHITYNEWVTSIFAPEYIDKYDLRLRTHGYSYDYDPKINAGTYNEFATAAFRAGHSLIEGTIAFKKGESSFGVGEKFTVINQLRNVYFKPQELLENDNFDNYLNSLTQQHHQQFDEWFTEDVTQYLFKTRNEHHGLDLVAFNLQRGKDHGIPPYNYYRAFCGLPITHRWHDLYPSIKPELISKLQRLYSSVYDIDLYAGGISERPIKYSIFGPTFACLVAKQLRNLKKGDRFWYENGGQPNSFTPGQLQQIRKVTMARLLCSNGDNIKYIQKHAFLKADFDNTITSCAQAPVIDFDYWTAGFDGYSPGSATLGRGFRSQENGNIYNGGSYSGGSLKSHQGFSARYGQESFGYRERSYANPFGLGI